MASAPYDRAFERLYRRHARDVYRFVLAVVRNPAEAEDVTQTAFLNAYRAFKRGERPERPHSWLLAIAHNAIRSRYRWWLRRPREVPLDESVQALAVPAEEQESVAEVLEALGELPVNQREALAMRELEGRSYGEIAATLGVSVPAVESLIARARRNLRRRRASLRGLTVVQLPVSLRALFAQGDPTGSGLAARAAAVVAAAGVAAGGVAVATHVAGASQPDGVAQLEPSRPHLVLPSIEVAAAPAPGRPHAAIRAPARPAPARHARAAPRAAPVAAPAPAAPPARPVVEAARAPAPASAATAPPAAAAPTPPAAAAVPRPADVVATVTQALPVQAPVPLPAPPPLPVTLPSVPSVPQVPVPSGIK